MARNSIEHFFLSSTFIFIVQKLAPKLSNHFWMTYVEIFCTIEICRLEILTFTSVFEDPYPRVILCLLHDVIKDIMPIYPKKSNMFSVMFFGEIKWHFLNRSCYV